MGGAIQIAVQTCPKINLAFGIRLSDSTVSSSTARVAAPSISEVMGGRQKVGAALLKSPRQRGPIV